LKNIRSLTYKQP